jgi:hypothetical protein
MAPSTAIEDHTSSTAGTTKLPEPDRMMHLQIMIDELSKRADQSDLIGLFATSRQARLYNADLARELRDVVRALKRELDRRHDTSSANLQFPV